MMGLTRKQHDVLEAIRALTVDGVSPSFDEIAHHCGLSSKSGVHRCIEALRERGVIRRQYGRARALEIIGADPLDGLSPGAMLALRDRIDRRLEAVA